MENFRFWLWRSSNNHFNNYNAPPQKCLWQGLPLKSSHQRFLLQTLESVFLKQSANWNQRWQHFAVTKEEHIAKTIPKNISVWVTIFLRLKNITISSRLQREKVSRDSGYGFEILYEYLLAGNTRAVEWLLQKCKRKRILQKLVSMKQERISRRRKESATKDMTLL